MINLLYLSSGNYNEAKKDLDNAINLNQFFESLVKPFINDVEEKQKSLNKSVMK